MFSMASLAVILLSHFDRKEVFSIKLQLKVTLQARDYNAYYIVWFKNNFNTLYITYIVPGYLGNLNFSACPRKFSHFRSASRVRLQLWLLGGTTVIIAIVKDRREERLGLNAVYTCSWYQTSSITFRAQ